MQEDAGLQPTTLNVEDDLTLPTLGLPHADCILVATQHDPDMGTTFSKLGGVRGGRSVTSGEEINQIQLWHPGWPPRPTSLPDTSTNAVLSQRGLSIESTEAANVGVRLSRVSSRKENTKRVEGVGRRHVFARNRRGMNL